MDDEADDKYSGYAFMLEQRADYEQQLALEERRRYDEAHPEYAHCPKHPEREVVDRTVSVKRYCAECIADHQRNYADRERKWGPECDMRYYRDDYDKEGRSI